MKLKFNKKAQVATTMTWIVATIIIIVMLAISIIFTSVFGKRTYTDTDSNERTDLLIAKSFLSYLLTKENSANVFEKISEEGNLNDFNGNLAKSIFFELYPDYKLIWLSVLEPKIIPNIYFKPIPCGRGNYENIELTGNKKIELAYTTAC